jgi:hypothetical protein
MKVQTTGGERESEVGHRLYAWNVTSCWERGRDYD